MHEMGIALQIIEIAQDAIPAELTAPRVLRIHLSLGKLSAVVPASLRFCFDLASRETVLEGAELAIHEIPVRAQCKHCRHEWTIEGPVFTCTACQSGEIEIVSGRELDIDSIELADKEESDAPDRMEPDPPSSHR